MISIFLHTKIKTTKFKEKSKIKNQKLHHLILLQIWLKIFEVIRFVRLYSNDVPRKKLSSSLIFQEKVQIHSCY